MKAETKGKIKGIIAGTLATALLVGGGVYAAQRSEMIEVFYDDIEIVVDGQKITPKDANGNTVHPFIYNGTTYLPVRAVGNAIGKDVSWDGVEKVVYLGAVPGKDINWFQQCKPYQTYYLQEYSLENNTFFEMTGKKYSNGYHFGVYKATALYNLNGKYDRFSCTVGHLDGTAASTGTLNIYLDGTIAYTKKLSWEELNTKISIPLNGALQMKIEAWSDDGNCLFGISEGKFE